MIRVQSRFSRRACLILACAVALLAAACNPIPDYPRSGVVGSDIVEALDSPLAVRPPVDCDTLVEQMKAEVRTSFVPATTTTTPPTVTTVLIFGGGPPGSSRLNYPSATAGLAGSVDPDVPLDVILHEKRLYVVRWGVLRIFDVSGTMPVEVGSLDLGDLIGRDRWTSTLLLRGDSLYLFRESPYAWHTRTDATIAAISLMDPARPVVTASLQMDGSLDKVHIAGPRAHLVVNQRAKVLGDIERVRRDATLSEEVLDASTQHDWVGSFTLTRGTNETGGPIVPCTAIDRAVGTAGTSRSAIVAIDLNRSLSAPSGRAVPPSRVAAIRDGSLELVSSMPPRGGFTSAEQAVLREQSGTVARTFDLGESGPPRLTGLRLLEPEVHGDSDDSEVSDAWNTISIGDGRMARIRYESRPLGAPNESGTQSWQSSVRLTITERNTDGTSRTTDEAQFDVASSGWGSRPQWNKEARQLYVDVSAIAQEGRVLAIDLDDPDLKGVVLDDVSLGSCTASFVTVSNGARVWLVDDAIRTFDRETMTQQSRYNFPDPASIFRSLPVCD